VVVAAGILLALGDPLKAAAGAHVEPPSPAELSGRPPVVAPGPAISAALATFPGSKLSIVEMPGAGTPYYKIRVLRSGEMRRFYGTTTVFIDAGDGRVLRAYDALRAAPGRAF